MSKTFGVLAAAGLVAMMLILAGCGNKATPILGSPKITVADTVAPQNDALVDFGTTAAGYSSMEAVVITNTGSANLVIGTIAGIDALAAPFSIALDSCSGATLAPGSKCDLLLRFAPVSSGLFTDTFDIPSNDPDIPAVAVGVMGSGTFAVPRSHIVVTDPVAPVDDRIIFFGTLNMGTVSSQTFTVSNDGSVSLVIGQIGQAYALTGPFGLTDTCSGASLAPSETCTITVEFHPNSAGNFSGGFDIPSNDPGGSVVLGVAGTGVDLISPARLQFGNVVANQTSDLAVTVTNNGAADLVIGQIAGLDPLGAPFSIVSDGCSTQTLAPAASCQVTVRFAPTADGSYSDTFDVPTSGDVTGDFPVYLSGISGTGIVSGTITLPAPATGICYAVVLNTSLQPANLLDSGVAVATGQTDGTSTITYSFTNVPPGQYYLYAGVDNDASSASSPDCSFANGMPTHGDYVGFYGGGIPSSPNAIVSIGTNTLDFSLTTY